MPSQYRDFARATHPACPARCDIPIATTDAVDDSVQERIGVATSWEYIVSSSTTARLLALALLVPVAHVQAQDDWNLELSPYLWAVSTDADVTVDAQTARVKRDFEDVDLGGSVLSAAHIARVALWMQLDFLTLDTDELERSPVPGRLETDVFLATLGVGYQFSGPRGSTFDVLLGVRRLGLDSKLTLNGVGRFAQDDDFTDAVVIVRPSWSLGERWRFNPTLSFGGGDSKVTWELQPQLQYLITDSIALRFGYRRIYYKIDSHERVDEWDGALQGMIFGIGGLFDF
jgi:hypothetical protein